MEAEEVELGAEPAVVALLGLLEHAQVVLELLLRREDGAVDPLQLRAVLVALPVGPGDREELDVLEQSRSKGTWGPRQKSTNGPCR